MDLTRALNAMFDQPRDTQERTRTILLSLFPAWLPPAFKVIYWRDVYQSSIFDTRAKDKMRYLSRACRGN